MKRPNPTLRPNILVRIVLSMVTCVSLAVPMRRSAGIRNTTEGSERRQQHAVTVADAIQMTQFGDLNYIRGMSAKYDVAHFSPNGKQFVIVTARGNIDTNTNEYFLLLFQTDQALRSPVAEVLVTMSSSSNSPGISDITWVNNSTIAFRGENPGEVQQVYEVDCETRRITKLTNQPSGITAYAFTPNGKEFFFLTPRPEPFLDGSAARQGVVITTQLLPDLLAGKDTQKRSEVVDLFVKKRGQEVPIRIQGDFYRWSPLWPSPNGQYLIAMTTILDIPENWRDYEDYWLQAHIRTSSPSHSSPKMVSQYELINIESGQTGALLEAPAHYVACGSASIVWSPDGNSVVVSGEHLPLNVADPVERKLRQSKKMVAEIKMPGLKIVPITSREVCPLRWDSATETLLMGLTSYRTQVHSYEQLLAFQEGLGGWKEIAFPQSGLGQNDRIAITLEEDMNAPPKLFVRDVHTGQKSLLLDLNPQFKDLKFGPVQNVTFAATDGHKVSAGLYLPPDYVAGKRYPLVIQTHGWDPERFWIDGVYSSGSAAQPLVGRGIVVLQVDEGGTIGTAGEYREKASAYEGAIDYLDRSGVVDRDRVGIVGFSRTGLGVEYALTHSKYHFTAATLADHSDGGYFAYLSRLPGWGWTSLDSEAINGGLPFGDHLVSWMRESPGFNLTKVRTPVREEAYSAFSLPGAWEWFAGLSRLSKPVELIYIPDGDHVLVKPWERMVSQQGNVDWFSFWLQGYEDPNPDKADQYKRWRQLRKMEEEGRTAK
jgi:dipeptidyl aminopeptidase/acylaminoacyl peptidase